MLCKMILMDIARETGVGEIIDDTAFCWQTTSDDGVDIFIPSLFRHPPPFFPPIGQLPSEVRAVFVLK